MEKSNNIGGAVAADSPPPMMGSRAHQINEDYGNGALRTAEPIARLVPMGLCVAALVLMLKNSETNDFGSLSYSDLGAFRYLYSFLLFNFVLSEDFKRLLILIHYSV